MQSLFLPGRIGAVEVPNRIVMPSMTTRSADAEGYVTEDTVAYFLARARGGVGLVTVEMASPEAVGRHRYNELGIYDDRFLPGLTRLVRELKGAGARTAIQLGHGGGHTRRDICGETPIAPSAIAHPVFERRLETIVPEAMSLERIRTTQQAFVAASKRAAEAGFDCVELHAAHGYLISQFLCPYENRRKDAYGGTLENRARFGLEILRRIKAEVPGVAVIYRIGVEDFFPEGLRFVEGREVAVRAAEAGADAVHVSAGHYRSRPSAAVMIPPMAMPEATFLEFAAAVKPLVKVPVIAVGRLGDPHIAAAAIAEGKADFVALGRSLLADPEWPNKVRRAALPRRCIACNSCVDGMRSGERLSCLVNPVTGRERRFATARKPRGRRIAVIGAGPAGLSYAALVAEGNHVTLFERRGHAGGAFRIAGCAPLFQEVEASPKGFLPYIEALLQSCREQGVELRFGFDPLALPESLSSYDRIVLATGADYRAGLAILPLLLRLGVARLPVLSSLARSKGVRDWFYYRARRSSRSFPALQGGQELVTVGDARNVGKSGAAIASAFAAALLENPDALHEA